MSDLIWLRGIVLSPLSTSLHHQALDNLVVIYDCIYVLSAMLRTCEPAKLVPRWTYGNCNPARFVSTFNSLFLLDRLFNPLHLLQLLIWFLRINHSNQPHDLAWTLLHWLRSTYLLELKVRLELTTYCLQGNCSTYWATPAPYLLFTSILYIILNTNSTN